MLNSRVQVLDPLKNKGEQYISSMGQPGNRYGDLAKPRHLAIGRRAPEHVDEEAEAHAVLHRVGAVGAGDHRDDPLQLRREGRENVMYRRSGPALLRFWPVDEEKRPSPRCGE